MRADRLLRLVLRDSRGARGHLLFFIACLSVGVAAVVAVAGLGASLESGVQERARELLAADLSVESRRRPLPDELDAAFAGLAAELGVDESAIERTTVRELVSVVAATVPVGSDQPGRSRLAELKVVAGTYPFYGTLGVEPAEPLADLLARGAVVAPEMLSDLGLDLGDSLRVGATEVPIVGVVTSEPDRMGGAFGFVAGPRLFLSDDTFAAAELDQVGSRIVHRELVRLPAGVEAGRAGEILNEGLAASAPAGSYDIETWVEAQPSLRAGIERIERFLGLVALLSLLVGGIGVAQTVRAWIAGRLDAIAVLKCLGLTSREILTLYLGQTAVLGLVGSAAGLALGVAVQLALPEVLGDLVPREIVDPWSWGPLARGLALGIGVAMLFGAPPVVRTLAVPPARVLSRLASPLPVPRRVYGVAVALGLVGVWVMAWVQSSSALDGLRFAGGVIGATLVLAGAARLLVWGVSRIPRTTLERIGLAPRHALAALSRPGAGTLAAVVALGLGIMVVVGMWLVQRHLVRELSADLPQQAPSVFLVDIQPEQWPTVRAILEEADAEEIDSVPVVTARIGAIDGLEAEVLTEAERQERRRRAATTQEEVERENRQWALTREQRLTWLDELPEDNEIVAGALWSEPDLAEVAVEEEFAGDLGVELGSTIRFDIQGVPVETTVTAIRTVDWSTFGLNFFLVVEPGVLDAAPHTRVAAARLPAAAESPVQDRLAAAAPNVLMLRLREILEKIVAILDRISLGVRVLGLFTVVAGVLILAGAVSATTARRSREVALFKTLGITRGGVVAIYALEYALTGLVAGVIGTVAGAVLAYFALERGMEIEFQWEPALLALAVVLATGTAVAAGLAASAQALARRPVAVLRG